MEDRIDRVVRDRALDRGPIADIGMDEREPRVARHTVEVGEVPRVDDDLLEPGTLAARGQHPTREVAAGEASAPTQFC